MGKISRFFHPTSVREAIRNIAFGTMGLIAGTWFIALLTQYKWFEDPKHQVSEVAQFFSWLVSENWFIGLSGITAGFAAGVFLDAYLVRRNARLWWHNVQAFTIRDAACLLAGAKRSDFEKSDRAIAIANELRGFINSGQVPLFLEFEFERAVPDFSDPKARYEPPYDRKDVGFDAVISKRTIEGMARGRKWSLPWPIPPRDQHDERRPFPRPKQPPSGLAALLPKENHLGKLGPLRQGNNAHPAQQETKPSSKLGEPYREAVLQLQDVKLARTKLSGSNDYSSAECDLVFKGKQPLSECRVWFGELRTQEGVEHINAYLRTGRNEKRECRNTFAINRPSGPVRLAFIRRDLTDLVSNPPFLVLTDQGNFPLADQMRYELDLELRSEAKYPTKVTLAIETGVKEELGVTIARQWID